MVDAKTAIAVIITILAVFFFASGFSEFLGVDIQNPLKGREVLPDRRELPVEGELSSSLESLKFSQSGLSTTRIVFSTTEDIAIGSTKIKPGENAHVSFSNFTGLIDVSNGSVSVKGIANSFALGDYKFVGANTVNFNGKLVELEANIETDIRLPQASGSLSIVVNSTSQTLTVKQNEVFIKSFKGHVKASYDKNELELNGLSSRITAAGITITK